MQTDRQIQFARQALPVLALCLEVFLLSCGNEQEPCTRAVYGATMLEPEFVLVEPATYEMGAQNDEHWEHPQMTVTVTRPFWIQTSEVTNAEYRRVEDAYVAWRADQGFGDEVLPGEFDETDKLNADIAFHPSYNVFAIPVFYANARSVLEGYTPCYDLRPCRLDEAREQGEVTGIVNLVCTVAASTRVRSDCEGYRLPTEAEWELAARGGDTSDYQTGETCRGMSRYAAGPWNRRLDEDEVDRWSGGWPIGQLCPNELGLYDMNGNVREWTNDLRAPDAPPPDLFIDFYYGDDLVDPTGNGPELSFDATEDRTGQISDPNYTGGIPMILAKGGGEYSECEDTYYSNVSLLTSPELAGFRVVRTAYEVMDEGPPE